jgi:hypothetical protein
MWKVFCKYPGIQIVALSFYEVVKKVCSAEPFMDKKCSGYNILLMKEKLDKIVVKF